VPKAKAAKSAIEPSTDIVDIFSNDEIPQRSEKWFAIRRGIPTASKFAAIMADGRDGGESLTRQAYLDKLAGEIMSGQTDEDFQTEAMRRGNEMEDEALEWYEQEVFDDVQRVGFIRRTINPPLGHSYIVGCSPDGYLPKQKRLVQIKTMRPDLIVKLLRNGPGGFTSKHRAQCQGELMVSGADSCDLICFYRGWPDPPRFTLERDDQFIARLREECERFSWELSRLVSDTRAKGRRR
jgi:hypothetical protein